MTDHDPLCYQSHRAGGPSLDGPCECVVIRQVRADERERIAQAIETEQAGYDGGYVDGLATAARIARDALRAGNADE